MGRRVLQEIVVEVDVGTITVRTEPARTEEEEGRTYDTDNVRVILEQGMLRIRAPKAAAGRRLRANCSLVRQLHAWPPAPWTGLRALRPAAAGADPTARRRLEA